MSMSCQRCSCVFHSSTQMWPWPPKPSKLNAQGRTVSPAALDMAWNTRTKSPQ
jgi:hypothetical protein